MRKNIAIICALLLVCVPLSASAYHSSVVRPLCHAEYHYDNVTDLGKGQVVTEWHTHSNTTPFPETFTFTESTTKSVGISFSVTVEASYGIAIGDAVLLGVKLAINTTVTKTIATTTGFSVAVMIPSGWEGDADFGIYVQMTKGHLYTSNCPGTRYDYGPVITYTPYGEPDWCEWTRGPDKFGDGSDNLYRGSNPACIPAPPLKKP